jgi:16S rRNA (guanine527-N7)-methyltransferase
VRHSPGPGKPAGDRGLGRLGQRYGISPDGQRQLALLVALVAEDPFAPTRVRDPETIMRDHVADSLVALELEPTRSAERIADLGAGAGFPGLPLAIALPAREVTLVESNARKCEFLTRVVQACAVENVTVANTRAETWADGVGGCDLVLARALAPLAVVAEYAAPLLRLGGGLLAWRGRRDAGDEAAGARAAAELGLEPVEPVSVTPYRGALHRHLHLMVKVSATPGRFPRRPGMAGKRPLGALKPGSVRPPSDREQR